MNSDSGRVRIRINQMDGTCPTSDEPCAVVDRVVPFPRGKDVKVSIVHDDGTETHLRNVKAAFLRMGARCEPVIAVLELYNPIVDVTVPARMIGTDDPESGDFLGEDRTNLSVLENRK